MTDERMRLMNSLVNEVTKDELDIELIKTMLMTLGIPYSDDPMQLLNNVLKGIHSDGFKNESTI